MLNLEAAREILAKALDIPIEKLGNDASIDTLDRWDSLGHMRIVLGIEEKLGRELETDEVLNVSNVKAIASVLSRKS